ncbi:MAG TPA: hypothetical protein PKJ99_12265 [Thermoanaerobaculales bacterium]|nr:hypothetical protein [Thermoanaerobaculales bacterium]
MRIYKHTNRYIAPLTLVIDEEGTLLHGELVLEHDDLGYLAGDVFTLDLEREPELGNLVVLGLEAEDGRRRAALFRYGLEGEVFARPGVTFDRAEGLHRLVGLCVGMVRKLRKPAGEEAPRSREGADRLPPACAR